MSEPNKQRRGKVVLKAWEPRRQRQEPEKALLEQLSGRQIEAVKRFLHAFERLHERMSDFSAKSGR
jgi:hypothetical protein